MDHFFDSDGDYRMERQNLHNWYALFRHIRIAMQVPHSLPGGTWDVLDVGCHAGGMLEHLRREFGGKARTLAGVEPLDGQRNKAQERLPGGTFFSSIEEVPDQSIDLVVSHETLYLVPSLSGWIRELKRVLRPTGAAFIALGSHGENTAWLRWRNTLKTVYEHESYVYEPLSILEAGARAGFEMEVGRLHLTEAPTRRFSPPEDGWGEFASVEELLEHPRWKYLFIFYPELPQQA